MGRLQCNVFDVILNVTNWNRMQVTFSLNKSYKCNGGLIIVTHPIHPNTISILRDNRLQFNAIGLGGILLIEAIAIWNSYKNTLCVLCLQVGWLYSCCMITL